MFDFDLLKDKFNLYIKDNKIFVNSSIVSFLGYLKQTPECSFDMLTSIVAVDLGNQIELIYQLYSTISCEKLQVSVLTNDSVALSVTSVYKSANFDECEIYDLFGVKFLNNDLLKRLFMPESWIGYPLLKNYEMKDERLAWNE